MSKMDEAYAHLLKIIKNISLIFFLLLFFIQPIWSDQVTKGKPAKLQLLEVKQRQNQTTLIFTLKGATTPNFFLLPNPDRLVMDLPATSASSALPKDIRNKNSMINRISLGNGPFGPGNLRVVLGLAAQIDYVYLLDQDLQKATQKITVILTQKAKQTTVAQVPLAEKQLAFEEALDLENRQEQAASAKKTPVVDKIKPLTTGQANLIEPKWQSYTPINTSPMKKVIIMIDPGHGGKDSGAIGPGGMMEKNIVLAISRKLQKILNDSQGIDARLTRKSDYFISLRQRLNIARYNKANMFIAIHADAFNDTAQGASVFALSQHGATSEAARWLADRENTSELSGINFKNKDYELKSILLDMSQTATIQDSVHLGNYLLGNLKPLTPLHSQRVEQAGFMVLKSPDIPSVLVETGFVSNPSEEKLLTSADYQDKLAQALAQGIENYFAKNPPPGSWFEMQYKNAV